MTWTSSYSTLNSRFWERPGHGKTFVHTTTTRMPTTPMKQSTTSMMEAIGFKGTTMVGGQVKVDLLPTLYQGDFGVVCLLMLIMATLTPTGGSYTLNSLHKLLVLEFTD